MTPPAQSRGLNQCFTIPHFLSTNKGKYRLKRVKPHRYSDSTPMLMSPDIAECLDPFCAGSNFPLLKLAEAQDQQESGVMAPLIER